VHVDFLFFLPAMVNKVEYIIVRQQICLLTHVDTHRHKSNEIVSPIHWIDCHFMSVAISQMLHNCTKNST